MTASANVDNAVGGHPSTSASSSRRQTPTSKKSIFLERICMLNSKANPGIPIESSAQAHVQMLLFEILYSLIDAKPTGIADMDRCMQAALPSTTYHWILKNYDRNALIRRPKQNQKGSRSDRNNAKLLQEDVSNIYKEYTGQKPDQKIVHELISVIECIATDILQWTGKYVKNIPHCQPGIGLQNLKIALSADKSLIDLTEMLKNDDDESTTPPAEVPPVVEESVVELNYEKLSKDMLREDSQYLNNLSLLVNVFKRQLELEVTKLESRDPKQYIDRIFGSIEDVYELSLKLHRFLQDAVEMSEIHCVGNSGLWELCEAKDFNCYLDYTKLFTRQDSLTVPIREMLADPLYAKFFHDEDRAYGLTGCQTFQMAMKYILPKLLEEPVHHIVRFTNYYLLNLMRLTRSEDDRAEIRNSYSYLKQIAGEMSKIATKAHEPPIYTNRGWQDSHRSQQRILQEIQKSIEGWQGREILHKCSRLLKEGTLLKGRHANHISKTSRTERYVFLFDNLLVLCKPKKSDRNHGYTYKFKSKYEVRKTDIYDIPDSEDCQHAFRIVATTVPHGDYQESTEIILICRSADDKFAWLSSVIDIHTRSLLDRKLEVFIKQEEKRVPLEIPGPDQYRFSEPDTDEHIIFEDYTSNSGIPVVKLATILKLVERLTFPLYSDAKFVQTFLTTYRSFCQPEQLLQLLIERYNVPTPRALESIDNCAPVSRSTSNAGGGPLAGRYDTVQSHGLSVGRVSNARLEQSYQRFRMDFQLPIQKRVIAVCDQWLRYHFYDFESNPQLVDGMVAFLNEARSKIGNSDRWKIKKILDKIRNHQNQETDFLEVFVDNDAELTLPRRTNSQNGTQISRPPILWHTATPEDPSSYDLLTLHPVEIGRQLTLLHFELYKVVKPIELVDCAWMKADKLQRSPQLMQCMDKTNLLIYWVAKSIVETESMEERVALVSRVVEIMFIFEELNNFNGIVAFNSALGSSAVARLKATFERLDKEKQKWLGKFKKLCDAHGVEMAKRIPEVQGPVIPFIGTYLSRFCFLDEGRKTIAMRSTQVTDDNEGYDSTQMIEFGTCRKTAGLIREIQMYQNLPYQFQVEPSMRLPSTSSMPRHCTRACAGPPPRYENFRAPTPCSANFSAGINDYLTHCGDATAMIAESLSLDLLAMDGDDVVSQRRHSIDSASKHKVVQKTTSDCALPTRRPKHSRNVILRKWNRLRQFFESINPLDGFEDSNALEEYLYNQSKKLEPGKEDSKWELHKPKRSTHTLKSPGVKVPKWQQVSSSLTNGSPASPNPYHPSNPGNLTLPKPLPSEDRTRSSATVSSPVEDCPFAIVDIHPGQQPKYIRDATPGTIISGSQRSSLPPRRNIPPPSPSAKSEVPQEMAPPPLFPRRISPARTEDSPPASATSDRSFFPTMPSSPTDSAWASSSESGTSPPTMAVPPVPPRRAANKAPAGLPAPLPVDSVSKHFWRGEPSPTSPTVSLSVPLPTEPASSSPPALPPRHRPEDAEPAPPRPPKKNPGRPLPPVIESDGPTPPPLPPKTYKNRIQRQ